MDAYTVKGSVYVDDLHLIIVFKLKAKRKKVNIIEIKQISGSFRMVLLYCAVISELCVCVLMANGSFKPFFLWTGAVSVLNLSPLCVLSR